MPRAFVCTTHWSECWEPTSVRRLGCFLRSVHPGTVAALIRPSPLWQFWRQECHTNIYKHAGIPRRRCEIAERTNFHGLTPACGEVLLSKFLVPAGAAGGVWDGRDLDGCSVKWNWHEAPASGNRIPSGLFLVLVTHKSIGLIHTAAQ